MFSYYRMCSIVSTETYSCGKRDLLIWQKRPNQISIPEVCMYVKRDLLVPKETYSYRKEAY